MQLFAINIFRPVLSIYSRNFEVASFSSCVRYFSKHEFNKSKRAEFRMSPNVFRQKKLYKAVVQNVFDASPSIKVMRLHVSEPDFTFKAGQWVDFYVPGIQEVTGYSMTSAPHEAKEKGLLDLAVKYGKFPPTHWVHNECRSGVEVTIRVGGDFYYDPQPGTLDATADLLLIGGGVGVNPLVSILSEYCYLMDNVKKWHKSAQPGNAHLLYSAKTLEDLIFMDNFTVMEQYHPSLSCQYFVTCSGFTTDNPKIKCSRICESEINDSIKKLQTDKTLCYICGPSTMTDDMAGILLKLGVKEDFIRYEKWW